MKYRFFILILFLACIPVAAQHFKGGLALGINGSQVDGDTYAGYNKLGFMAGPYVFYPLSNKWDMQVELKYMGKGAARRKTGKEDYEKYTNTMHYIEIPVIFRYNSSAKLGFEGGLGFGYLFSVVEKDEYGVIADGYGHTFSKYEVCSLIGARYRFLLRMAVNIRYSYSLTSVFDRDIVGHGGYNNLFSIGIFHDF